MLERAAILFLVLSALPDCREPAPLPPPPAPLPPPGAVPSITTSPLFQDPDRSAEKRIDDLLQRLTLDEKIECLGTNPSVPRLGIRASGHVEGLHGLALGIPGGWGRGQPITTTTFPQSKGLGETWDPVIVGKAAEVESTEARWVFHVKKRGGIVVRAPNADLARDPRWGRSEESFGEDPMHASAMATAFARGLQGDDAKYWRAASLLKHFVANTNENDRDKSSSDFDDRLFHEYYAAAFRSAIVNGGARAYMAAYNAHNGTPCTTHPMLQNVTALLWGQDGIKCTDGGALGLLYTAHKKYPSLAYAAAASIKAGISQFLDRYREPVRTALADKLLTEDDIDRVLRQNFRVMIRLGLLDPDDRVPYAKPDPDHEPWHSEAHKSLALRATRESIVLLKNDPKLLPLDVGTLKSVAVVGARAGEVLFDWYSGTPPYAVAPVEGIKRRLGKDTKLFFARDDQGGLAVKAAKSAEVAIVVVGNHPTGDVAAWAMVALPSYGREAVDRQSITLEDEELVKKVVQANPKTIVVLVSSFPYAIAWTLEHVPAVVHLTHASQDLGTALADVIFGAYNPAGRLVETWPRSIADLPPMLDYDVRHGRTYQYAKAKPLLPFGFGLSYTTFAYAALRTKSDTVRKDGSITVTVDVENTGDRDGDEVVQLYVKHLGSNVARPIQELKAFRRVAIPKGETKAIDVVVRATDLGYWDETKQAFEIEAGPVELRVGRSSADIELTKTIRVTE
jgi:beta-glucosidase